MIRHTPTGNSSEVYSKCLRIQRLTEKNWQKCVRITGASSDTWTTVQSDVEEA